MSAETEVGKLELGEVKKILKSTLDIDVVNMIAEKRLLNPGKKLRIDREVVSEVLVKQRLLAFGGLYGKRWAEADRAGVVMKTHDQRTARNNKKFYATEWNQAVFFLCTAEYPDEVSGSDQAELTDAKAMAKKIFDRWNSEGIEIDDVMIFPAENQGRSGGLPGNTGQSHVETIKYRVWIKVGRELGMTIEEKLARGNRSANPDLPVRRGSNL